jgi:hypothetical protein
VSQSQRWRRPLARWETIGGGSRPAASYLSPSGSVGQYRLSLTLDMQCLKRLTSCSRSGKAQLSHFRSVQEALARNSDILSLGNFDLFDHFREENGMENSPLANRKGPRIWLIHSCRWLWGKRSIVWVGILLSITLNLLATLLFFRWPWSTNPKVAEEGSFVRWMLQNPGMLLVLGIVLLLTTCIIGLISRFDPGLSSGELKRRYLHRIILETERLTLTGIPAGLIAQSVPLNEIFIPLQLRPNRPLVEYPLTEDQLRYVRECLERGVLQEDMEQLLIAAEKEWHRLTQRDPLSIAELWAFLTKKVPAAVIQGYPGMGKSTLLLRLMLHMARRSLGQLDPGMNDLYPPCIPILVQLGSYATEWAKVAPSSRRFHLSDYLTQMLDEFRIPGLNAWFQQNLLAGHCLVLLDGLDEVSDIQERNQVQKAIATFILDYRNTPGPHFNRFLITSRVAGYDQSAFPDFPH